MNIPVTITLDQSSVFGNFHGGISLDIPGPFTSGFSYYTISSFGPVTIYFPLGSDRTGEIHSSATINFGIVSIHAGGGGGNFVMGVPRVGATNWYNETSTAIVPNSNPFEIYNVSIGWEVPFIFNGQTISGEGTWYARWDLVAPPGQAPGVPDTGLTLIVFVLALCALALFRRFHKEERSKESKLLEFRELVRQLHD